MSLGGGFWANFLEEVNLLGVSYSKLNSRGLSGRLIYQLCVRSLGPAIPSGLRLCPLRPNSFDKGIIHPVSVAKAGPHPRSENHPPKPQS